MVQNPKGDSDHVTPRHFVFTLALHQNQQGRQTSAIILTSRPRHVALLLVFSQPGTWLTLVAVTAPSNPLLSSTTMPELPHSLQLRTHFCRQMPRLQSFFIQRLSPILSFSETTVTFNKLFPFFDTVSPTFLCSLIDERRDGFSYSCSSPNSSSRLAYHLERAA